MNTDHCQAAHKPESAFDRAGLLNGDHGELVETSVRAMLANQQPNGAFIASPDFGQYQYCWLRDASFIAHALDRVGELEASALYHAWVAKAIEGIAPAMDSAVQHHRAGLALEPADMSPARFNLAGLPVSDDWPNFQIDGYGIWLWSLQEHLVASGSGLLADRLVPPVERTARYLATLALTPCFDVWEEDGVSVHTSTLACVYGGLLAAAKMLGDSEIAARRRGTGRRARARPSRGALREVERQPGGRRLLALAVRAIRVGRSVSSRVRPDRSRDRGAPRVRGRDTALSERHVLRGRRLAGTERLTRLVLRLGRRPHLGAPPS